MNLKEIGYIAAISTIALSACQEQKPTSITPIPRKAITPTVTSQPHTNQSRSITLDLRLPEPQNPSHGCDQVTFEAGFWLSHNEYSDDATTPGIDFRRSWLIQAHPDGVVAQHALGTANSLKDIGRAFYPTAQFPIGKFLGINTCWENWKTTQMDPITEPQPTA